MKNVSQSILPLLLSIKEVAESLGLCERTVWTLVQERQLPHLRIGRRLLFSRAALQEWVDRQQVGSKLCPATGEPE